MPNPKLGTVANDLTKAVKDIKTGLIEIRNDKDGNLASTIGRKSFFLKNCWKIIIILLRALKKNLTLSKVNLLKIYF